MLFDYHYGEGGYADTERAIQELLELDRAPVEPIRPEDVPDALLSPQTEDVEGPYSGPYEAGGVWAVLDGAGTVTANGATVAVDHPGCYELIAHARSTAGELALEVGPDGVTVNTVLAGVIATDRAHELGMDQPDQLREQPTGRLGTVEEFASVAAFLCSRQAAYVTGTALLVDGGISRSV